MNWLLVGVILAPIIHWRIRRTKFRGVRTIIAGLAFTPGLCATALGIWIAISVDSSVTRWSLVYYLRGEGAPRCLAAISGITAIYLGACLLLECFPRRTICDSGDGAVRIVRAWRSLVAVQLVLMAVTAYLYSYSTLGDAVTSGNLALAEKRLNWNLEGLGPNDGLIVKVGSLGLHRYPLLRMVVRNRDSDMRELLLKHGAEWKPTEYDEFLRQVWGD